MALSKNAYIAVLCLAFLYSVFMSYLNVLQEPTTFEEYVDHKAASLPSITFCNRQWFEDEFETFEDIMDAINDTQINHYSAQVLYAGKGLPTWTVIDLTNASMLQSELNLTMDEVWSHGPHMQYDWPNCLIICTTLNLPFIKAPPEQGFIQLVINVEDSTGGSHYVEKHQPGQSLHPFDFDLVGNFEIYHKGKGYTEMTSSIETISLKKSNYDCYEDNSMRTTDCINDFIAQQLDCSLPWTSNQKLEGCSGPEKLVQFRNLTRYIASYKDQLEQKGCLKPNCITKKWVKVYHEIWYPPNENQTLILFAVPDTSKTVVRREIRLADFATFMADCGSYLGLFLGASILSLSEIGVTAFKKMQGLVKYKKKNHGKK